MIDLEKLAGTHDLSLPEWGPYSKRFFGISHITDPERGDRFDFTVVPGLYRRQFGVPDALRPSGYLPWRVAPDLESYSYRQELEWKDKLYCDISFFAIDDHTRLVCCECVNRTELPTDFAVHWINSFVPEPSGCCVTDAEAWFRPRLPSPRGLVYDCFFPGERRMNGTVKGSAFLAGAGMPVRFELPAFTLRSLWLRARFDGTAELNCNGRLIALEGTGKWCFYRLYTGDRAAGEFSFSSDTELLIDGLALAGETAPVVSDATADNTPQILHEESDLVVLGYRGASRCYGLKLDRPFSFTRTYAVDDFMKSLLYEDYMHQAFLKGVGNRGGADRHFDAVNQPLRVEPGATEVLYAVIADGVSAEELAARLTALPADFEAIRRAGEARYYHAPESAFAFSQERMAAVTLSNVVYPTYFSGKFVRHHTPGRRWNSLYTWDSGFIGLAMAEIDTRRAIENLNAYLTEPGDPDNAFVHHGSPVPVQIYLFFELWNRLGDGDFLRYFYPRVRQYYRYLAGHTPGSLTRTHCKEPQICTWDYFYNSGGWDDYPPQHAVHAAKALNTVPVVGTAHLIRCAKMLRSVALAAGDSTEFYDEDIRRFSEALQTYSYDPQEGYFAYTTHDAEGNFTGIFRDAESGRNYNMGLDGAMPLVAGCTSPEQREKLWALLESPAHCWSDVGLSTVDRSAPYYRGDGYWNGSVWMPYQWFFWKAALNDGRGEFAWRIARTALEVWEREVAASYACYEQFSINSGRGTGWHHFSALSAPVLCWNGAYFREGTLTGGYDVCRSGFVCDAAGMRAELTIGGEAGEKTTLLAVLDGAVAVEYGGRAVSFFRRAGNCLEFELPKASGGMLKISKKER